MKARLRLVALAVAFAAVAACIPSVGPGDEIVTSPRLLAVRNDPAEAAPGTKVTFTAFVAAPDGDADDAGTVAVTWSFCDAQKPLTVDNVVSDACLGSGALTGIGTGAAVTAAMPGDACTHFGPDTSSSAFRPRDPDITGGYYQPVRADLDLASGATSFDLARIHCGLASASAASASAFAAAYTLNLNPQLLPVTATLGASGAAVDLAALPASTAITLQASWDPSSAETYAYYDPTTQSVTTQREAMQVAWYASAGALTTGTTGRSSSDMATITSVAFTTPATAGPLHLWIVLRDSRGGVDFTEVNATVW